MQRHRSYANGYTGEYTGDSTDLVYLRARYYTPGMGRFLNKDTWGGNYNLPLSLNLWSYAADNPIAKRDPSGHCYIDDLTGECAPVSYETSSTPNEPPSGLTQGSLYVTPMDHPASYSSQIKTYGGKQLWMAYLAMTCEHNTWWYADPSNQFDYEMFIGLMILQEANIHFTPGDETNVTLTPDYEVRANLVAQVVGTVIKYGGFRNYPCANGSCMSSLFNFWADHSQVAHNLMNDYYHLVYDDQQKMSVADTTLNEYAAGGPASIGGYYNRKTGNKTPPQLLKVLSEARELGFNALHNPNYAIQNGPIMYGLNSRWTGVLSSAKYHIRSSTVNGIDYRTIYYYTSDGVIFFTESQYGYWHGQLGNIVDHMDPMPTK